MKRLFVSAALVFALAGGMAVAQTPTTPAPDAQQPAQRAHHHRDNPGRDVKRLTKELNLTPDQASKLEPIFADRDQKIAALQANNQVQPQDLHKQMHEIQKSTNEQLATVLTPDQLQQLKAMHHEHGRHGAPGTQPLTPQAPPQA